VGSAPGKRCFLFGPSAKKDVCVPSSAQGGQSQSRRGCYSSQHLCPARSHTQRQKEGERKRGRNQPLSHIEAERDRARVSMHTCVWCAYVRVWVMVCVGVCGCVYLCIYVCVSVFVGVCVQVGVCSGGE
jgi:hypothetical protein